MAHSSFASLPPDDASSSSLAPASLGAHELANAAAPLASAWTLPPPAYADPSVWVHEVDSIFRQDWVGVARSSQRAEPGDDVADQTTSRIHLLLESDVAADPDVVAAFPQIREGLSWIHGEDMLVNEEPWRDLHAHLAAQGRLSPYERATCQCNQYWMTRIAP